MSLEECLQEFDRIVQELEFLVRGPLGGLSDNLPRLTERLRLVLSSQAFEHSTVSRFSTQQVELLRNFALRLWNAVVHTHQVYPNADPLKQSVPQINGAMLGINLAVRLTVCNIYGFLEPSLSGDVDLKADLIKFLAKTGQSFLDTNNRTMADNCWTHALEKFQAQAQQLKEALSAESFSVLEAAVLAIILIQMELIFDKGEHEPAFRMANQAVLLANNTDNVQQLSENCYHFGVRSQQAKKFAHAVEWFQLALKLSELPTAPVDKSHQANLLRLLANCYLSLNDLDTALNCADLANDKHDHIFGHFLKLKACLMKGQPDSHKLLLDFVSRPDATFETSYNLCLVALEMKLHVLFTHRPLPVLILLSRYPAAAQASSVMIPVIKNTQHHEKVRLLQAKMVLELKVDLDKAFDFLNLIISENAQGDFKMSATGLQVIYYQVWNIATSYYEQKNVAQAFQWFEYCKNLLPVDSVAERAKCLRVLAKCSLGMQNLDSAQSLVDASLVLDPSSIAALGLSYEIELSKQSPNLTILTSRLDLLVSKLSTQYTDMLEVYGSRAASVGQKVAAFHAFDLQLKFWATHDRLDPLPARKLVSLVRSALKLAQQFDNAEKTTKVVSVFKSFNSLRKRTSDLQTVSREELSWLAGVSWNTGHNLCFLCLHRSDPVDRLQLIASESYTDSSLVFDVGRQLFGFSSDPKSSVISTILSVASSLSVPNADEATISRALTVIQETVATHNFGKEETIGGMELADSLNILKFQALCQLGKPDLVGKVRDLVSTLVSNTTGASGTDLRNAYVLELVGALAARFKPSDFQQIVSMALKHALVLYFRSKEFAKCAALFRQRLLVCRDERDAVFEEVLSMAKDIKETKWSSDDSIWFAVESFNQGVHSFRTRNMKQAEKYMALSQQLLALADSSSQTTALKTQIMSSYTMVLSRLNKAE